LADFRSISECRISSWKSCELQICVPIMRQVIGDGSSTFSSAAAAAGITRYEEQKYSTPIIHVHRLLTEYAGSKRGGFPSREHSSLMNYGHSALRQALHNFDLSFQFPGNAAELKFEAKRSAPFWDTTQRTAVPPHRRIGTAFWSQLLILSPRFKKFCTSLPLERGSISPIG